jgi:hypothetical protein
MIMSFSDTVEVDVDCVSAISTLAYESIIPDRRNDPGRDQPPSIFVPPLEIVVSNEDEVPDWLRLEEGELLQGTSVERVPLSHSSPTQGIEHEISWESRCDDHSGPRLDELDDDIPVFFNSTIPYPDRFRGKKSTINVETIAAFGSLMNGGEDGILEATVRKERGSFLRATYVSVFHGRRTDVRLTRSQGLFT